LLHDRLYAGAAHADTSTHRIDVGVVRRDGELGPAPGLARRTLHLDDALVDLRHLLAKELDQQSRVRPGEDDLRAAARELDVDDVCADAIALAVALARDLLLLRQHGIGAPQVHDDVLLLEALDRPRRQLALAGLELLEDAVALGVAHALDDVLLRRLRRD